MAICELVPVAASKAATPAGLAGPGVDALEQPGPAVPAVDGERRPIAVAVRSTNV